MPKRVVCRANECLLALYLLLITISSVFLYVTHNKLILAVLCVVLFIFFLFISRFVLCFFSEHCIYRRDPVTGRQCVYAYLAGTCACIFILMLWYIAFRPGFYGPDNMAQLSQAVSGHYDNWHPIWHTLVFYTLPVRLTGWAGSVVPFQMICFSLCIGYMCMVLYRYIGKACAVIVFAYVCLNPLTGYVLLDPLKDVPFAIAGTIAMTMTAAICFSRGEWSDNRYRCVILGFILANATLLRYNGILFTGLLMIALVFNLRFRRWILILAGFAATMVIVQGPVYHLIDAEISDTEVVQVVGLPMSVIGNAVRETPDLLDPEITEFAYSYAPAEVWEERYARGNFNLMKYGGVQNPNVVEETGALKITAMAAKCLVQSPQASMDALFALTDFVYGLDIQDKADIDIMHGDIMDNDYGLEYNGNQTLAGLLDRCAGLLKVRGWNFFRKMGFGILMVMIVILSRLKWTSANSWKRILLCLPVLAYDFGTMLLLSGHDARFFFISFMVCPIAVIVGMFEDSLRSTGGNEV